VNHVWSQGKKGRDGGKKRASSGKNRQLLNDKENLHEISGLKTKEAGDGSKWGTHTKLQVSGESGDGKNRAGSNVQGALRISPANLIMKECPKISDEKEQNKVKESHNRLPWRMV